MKESALVRKIMLEVRRRCPNCHVRKLADRYTRGYPDIIIYAVSRLPARQLVVLEVETKSAKGKLSRLQEAEGSKVNQLGLPAQVGGGILAWIMARSVENVMNYLEAMGCVEKE